ncbi:Alpha/Beta hydrolase protein [Melanogaster broomeanus]|nr:Alpha/Beta hydrolase protein [Melanogaster broomeanus]
MDLIKAIKETHLDRVNLPTLGALIPILNERKAEIEKIERREFKYGQRHRHNRALASTSVLTRSPHPPQLDVYYPPTSAVTKATTTPNGKLPILVFIYGGSYNTGARQFPEPYEMGYRALGSFFAQRGFATVIPDYRLVPEVRFPAASEDVRDALVWVAQNAPAIAAAASGPASSTLEPDPAHMFVMGHSAGAGARDGDDDRRWGEVHDGGPGQVLFRHGRAAAGERATGAVEEAHRRRRSGRCPVFCSCRRRNEPGWLKEQTRELMAKEIRERLESVGRETREMLIARGHNHVSVNWMLGTGDEEGEKWGYDVVDWIKERIALE